MPNPYFRFKQFTIYHDRCAMKVTTDSCLFGAWAAKGMQDTQLQQVLDIGTGTGLLSLMIAQKNGVVIDAIEIDEDTSQQAKENVEASPWKNRIQVFNQDILSFHPGKKYDCIISNPPFYENELVSGVQKKNIAHHSEQLTISQLFETVKLHMKEEACFFVLLPYKRKEEVESLLYQNKLYPLHTVIVRQSVKHDPFRIMIRATNKKPAATRSASIAIWDNHQQYTGEFTDLLKDYYLYL